MNKYEEKQQARRDRLEDKARKLKNESTRVYNRARSMADCIPFGQPIQIGHHSEGRDRRFRGRIHGTFGKAFALDAKADHYAQKAASVGKGGISSDDPAAIDKLRAELAKLEATQQQMKDANKLAVIGDFAGRVGFPSYMLTNNNANMSRIKERIKTLEANQKREDKEEVFEVFTYREDTEENRVMFIFEGKPAEAVRDLLKSHAFKWSPSRGAWVRQMTGNGLYAAQRVKEELQKS